MANKLKLEFNKPQEAALKFAKGKRGESTIPGKGDWYLYSLLSGEVLFIDSDDCQDPDQLFAEANIGARDPFTICLRKSRQGARYLEVKALSDAQEPALDPSRYPDENGDVQRTEALCRKLNESIVKVQQRKALPSKATPPAAPRQAPSRTSQNAQQTNTTPLPAGQTKASALMSAALISAIDAASLAVQYAASKGLAIKFGPEDYRAIAATLYIQACKDPLFGMQQTANGGTQPWRQ